MRKIIILFSLPLLFLFLFSCSKGMGFSFAETGKSTQTALSALGNASNSFDLSKETCKGEGNTLLPYYYDGDKDKFGTKENVQYICKKEYEEVYLKKTSLNWVVSSSDCDDSNPNVNPSKKEVCDDTETDDDCDGIIDPKVAYLDADGDGFGARDSSFATGNCMIPPSGDGLSYVFNNFDCDDTDATVGESDAYFIDNDSDGFGASGSEAKKSCESVEGYVLNDDDCNDDDKEIQTSSSDPDMEDKDCDEVDDKVDLCSGTNSSLLTKNDSDQDGCFGEEDCDDTKADPNKIKLLDNDCDGVLSYLDCNDNDAQNTGFVTNDKDRDCDGVEVDLDCNDNDENSTIKSTDADCDTVLTADDCDDTDKSMPVYDFDCDGVSSSTDCDDADKEETSTAALWYEDKDGDSSGLAESRLYACLNSLDSNFVDNPDDSCDDNAFYIGSDYEYFSVDSDCDGFCDIAETSVELDKNCDGDCDGGVDAKKDSDCDGVCDDKGTLGLYDTDCDGSCDNLAALNLEFYHDGSLVLCPPGYSTSGGEKCVSYCADKSCSVGWADSDEDDETECSWDVANRCYAKNYEIPCVGAWPHWKWKAVGGEAKAFDDPGSTVQGNGNWRTEPLLVTKDLFSETWEAMNIPLKDPNSLSNCFEDSCEGFDFDGILDSSSENVFCPQALTLNDDGFCEPEVPLNIIETTDGTKVLCPPGFKLEDSEGFCRIECGDGGCVDAWAENDNDKSTSCLWDKGGRCDPRVYHLPCTGNRWPMQTWGACQAGIKTFSEGGCTTTSGKMWKTNPMLLEDYVCE